MLMNDEEQKFCLGNPTILRAISQFNSGLSYAEEKAGDFSRSAAHNERAVMLDLEARKIEFMEKIEKEAGSFSQSVPGVKCVRVDNGEITIKIGP